MLMSSLSNFSFVFGRAICRKRLLPFADLACICPFSMWWAVLQQHQSQSSLQTPPFGHQNPSCHSFSHSQSLMLEYSLTFSCKIRVQDNIKVIIVPSLSLILALLSGTDCHFTSKMLRLLILFSPPSKPTSSTFKNLISSLLFGVCCVCVCVCVYVRVRGCVCVAFVSYYYCIITYS